MKKLNAFLLAVLGVTALHAAKIDQVIVRQQWPWSVDIKVEYRLLEVTGPVDISLKAYNGDVELPLPETAITGDRYGISDAVGTIIIDPVAAFGTEKVALANFKVKLAVSDSAANINEILYKVVSLEEPYGVTDITRKDFYNGKYGEYVTSYAAIDPEFSTSLTDVLIWTDMTNTPAYKKDYIVFRRIPAAGKSYQMGKGDPAVNGGEGIAVSFTKDFYIGVYELTQAQVERFKHRTSYETNALYAAMRPADQMYFTTDLRGSKQNENWPEEGCNTHVMQGSGLILDLQTKTGLLLDLPTEAMWEYACRAGTTTKLYTGDPDRTAAWNDPHAKKIVRAYGCNGGGSSSGVGRNCDLSQATNIVGSYLPNAWGLYDMLGNVREWCLDKWCESASLPGGEDPKGLTEAQGGSTNQGVQRGGSWFENVCCCYTRNAGNRGYNTQNFGARLCIYLDNGPDGRK